MREEQPMATTIFNLTDPGKPIAKLIRVQNGEVMVNIGHPVDIAMVAWVLKLAMSAAACGF
jgi:hypothetical protein